MNTRFNIVPGTGTSADEPRPDIGWPERDQTTKFVLLSVVMLQKVHVVFLVRVPGRPGKFVFYARWTSPFFTKFRQWCTDHHMFDPVRELQNVECTITRSHPTRPLYAVEFTQLPVAAGCTCGAQT